MASSKALCPHCKKPMSRHASTCPHCGAKLMLSAADAAALAAKTRKGPANHPPAASLLRRLLERLGWGKS